MRLSPNYLKDKICLNVLANSVENAKECYDTRGRPYCFRGSFKELF